MLEVPVRGHPHSTPGQVDLSLLAALGHVSAIAHFSLQMIMSERFSTEVIDMKRGKGAVLSSSPLTTISFIHNPNDKISTPADCELA